AEHWVELSADAQVDRHGDTVVDLDLAGGQDRGKYASRVVAGGGVRRHGHGERLVDPGVRGHLDGVVEQVHPSADVGRRGGRGQEIQATVLVDERVGRVDLERHRF